MNCLRCKTELVWQCDHDVSDESENMAMVTNLHCHNCECDVDVWYPKDTDDDGAYEVLVHIWTDRPTLP